MTKQMTFKMTSGMAIKDRKYLKTHRWLTFELDLKIAPPRLWALLGECKSKCEHIAGVPLRPDIARKMHEMYLAKGIHGTTAIEGNSLSETDVLDHIQDRLETRPGSEYMQQEVDNLLQECNAMMQALARGQSLEITVDRLKTINRQVLQGLQLPPEVKPGEIRTYEVGVMRYRGAPAEDCAYLLHTLCHWLNSEQFAPQGGFGPMEMALLKAITAHLYIEWIHAFGDGNGRSGRLLEAQILLDAGIPAPAAHLLSNHYNATRTEYLRQLAAASGTGGDAVPFLTYALEGFLAGLKEQLEYVRKLQMENTWINIIHNLFDNRKGKAAHRQKVLLMGLFHQDTPIPLNGITKISPRVATEYARMHPRTAARDVVALEKQNLLIREGDCVRANRKLTNAFLPVRAARE